MASSPLGTSALRSYVDVSIAALQPVTNGCSTDPPIEERRLRVLAYEILEYSFELGEVAILHLCSLLEKSWWMSKLIIDDGEAVLIQSELHPAISDIVHHFWLALPFEVRHTLVARILRDVNETLERFLCLVQIEISDILQLRDNVSSGRHCVTQSY